MSSTSSDDFDLPSSAFPDSAESDSTSSDASDSFSASSSDSYNAEPPTSAFAGLDRRLAACYHAVFGLAAWTPNSARHQIFTNFIHACDEHEVWSLVTLQDFFYHSDMLLRMLRRYDFMTGYETAYTDMWARVSMEEAVSRLGRLHTALRARGVRAVQEEITALLAAHAAPAARDRAILAYLAPYAPRAAFDNVDPWFNTPADSEASEAGDAGDADERDKENKRPTAADTSSAPPARPPPTRPRRTPAPKRHVPPDHRARVPALLARLRALA